MGCLCEKGRTGKYCELESLATEGVATKAFTGFMGTLIGIVVIFGGITAIARCRKDRDIEYAPTGQEAVISNPYGEVDSDLSDDDSHDGYEFKDIAIV